jgi:thymidylate synthase
MKAYLDILKNCLENGTLSDNRTGIKTIRIPWGATFEHDMSNGFPLVTTKFTPLKTISTELECFINGYTDKKWLQDRNCHIWDEWANIEAWKPSYDKKLEMMEERAKNAGKTVSDAEKKELQNAEMNFTRDLGPIYGWQWRHFGSTYHFNPFIVSDNYDLNNPGFDQLKWVVNTAKKDPNNRRLIVNAWNQTDMSKMALPPCHVMHQILIHNGKLNLIWTQRSCDMFLGIPFNIASYAMLLLLYAKELGYKPGILRGELHDVHIYENHVDQVKEQLSRTPYELPQVAINDENWNGMFNWHADGGYKYLTKYLRHEQLKGDVAR